MRTRKLVALTAGVGALLLPVGIAGAQTAETTTTPAPPGSSEAVALNVLDVVGVGHTSGKSDEHSSEGSANAVELGGEPLIDGATGGSQKGPGTNEGALFDTGDTPLGRVQVTPWGVTVEDDGTTRSSDSDAALLKLILIDSGTASVNVLHTNSKSSYTDEDSSTGNPKSKGSTVSDGAKANVGGEEDGITVTVLHSETSSEADGNSSYILGVNDSRVLSSDDSGESCAVQVPGVITLACLTAAGGAGSSSAAAAQASADLLGGAPIDVVAGTSQFGDGQTGPVVSPADISRDPATEPEVLAASTGSGSGMAVTGIDVAKGIAAGLALIALGMLLLELRRSEPLAS
ncbi:MAG TPA: hypothetical protein VMY88_02425 [Acidimicrobiales bacterium]|nr:hypothetical protein [Acidimicrobiales bacterium]